MIELRRQLFEAATVTVAGDFAFRTKSDLSTVAPGGGECFR
jgi:hypothetical protein